VAPSISATTWPGCARAARSGCPDERLLDRMGDEEDGEADILPQPQVLVLHPPRVRASRAAKGSSMRRMSGSMAKALRWPHAASCRLRGCADRHRRNRPPHLLEAGERLLARCRRLPCGSRPRGTSRSRGPSPGRQWSTPGRPPCGRGRAGARPAGELDRPLDRLDEAAHGLEQRALAAARGAQHHERSPP
jgi:hypothetical protein